MLAEDRTGFSLLPGEADDLLLSDFFVGAVISLRFSITTLVCSVVVENTVCSEEENGRGASLELKSYN